MSYIVPHDKLHIEEFFRSLFGPSTLWSFLHQNIDNPFGDHDITHWYGPSGTVDGMGLRPGDEILRFLNEQPGVIGVSLTSEGTLVTMRNRVCCLYIENINTSHVTRPFLVNVETHRPSISYKDLVYMFMYGGHDDIPDYFRNGEGHDTMWCKIREPLYRKLCESLPRRREGPTGLQG